MVFKAMILYFKAILGRGQPGLMGLFVINHAPGAGSIARPVDHLVQRATTVPQMPPYIS